MTASTFRLATAFRHGRTKIDDVYFEAPFKLMTPFANGRHSDFIVMLASPGFLKGDEAHIAIDFGPGTDSTIRTQSYEKVFDTADGSASRTIDLTARGDATAVFMPFPVIPFRNSSFMNVTTARISAESTFVYADVVTCGRVGMGERWAMKRFANRLRVFVDPPVAGSTDEAGSTADTAAGEAAADSAATAKATGRTSRRGRPPKASTASAASGTGLSGARDAGPRMAFADRLLLEPDAFDYTEMGMWREFTHCGVLYAHLPEPSGEAQRIAAEDALVDRIRSHADAVGFTGELGVSRAIDGVCVRLLARRGDDAVDFIRDIADIVTGRA